MPFQKLTVSFAGRTEAEQAAVLLDHFRGVGGEISVTFGANVDQWVSCQAYNASDKSGRLDLGSGVTGQARVMQELANLLNDPANAEVKARVNFLPLVTAGASSCCVGLCNLFQGKLNTRPVATDEYIAPLVDNMRRRLEAHETVFGLSNQLTDAGHDLQVGGGAQNTRAANVLAEQFRYSITAMLDAGQFRGLPIDITPIAETTAAADSSNPRSPLLN